MLRFTLDLTKDLSIADLQIAIFNYILSKQLNEDLAIRVKDINKGQSIEKKDKELLELLSLFSIDYKNIVYQSESLKYHQKLAIQLVSQKKAFSCFCSEEKLKELKNYDGFCSTLSDELVLNTNAPFRIRINKPTNDITIKDILKKDLKSSASDVDFFTILNYEKIPTNDYACAIDDMLMDISTIIRDEKYVLNTARQIHIRNSFAYEKEIKYIHIPTIKSDISVKYLIDEGFLPSAIANYLVLLGNPTSKEIFTLEDAISWFDIKNISKESLNFDIEKLKQINKKHLETIDDMRLSKILGFADSDIGKLGKLFLKEVCTIKEIKEKIELIFSSKVSCEEYEEEFIKIKDCLKNAPFIDDFSHLKKYIGENTDLEDVSLDIPLAYLLTGNKDKLNLNEIYPLIKNYLGEIVK